VEEASIKMSSMTTMNKASVIKAPYDFLKTNFQPSEKIQEDLVNLMIVYYNDPVTFAQQILNIFPDEQQIKVLTSLGPSKKLTIKSGRGAGKTWTAAIAIWWFLCTRYNAQIFVTAASGGTIMGAIWPTIALLQQEMHPLFKDDFIVQATQVKHQTFPSTWFCIQRTAKKENPEAMAGSHSQNMMYLIDEASGVDDAIFRAIFGSLTEKENYLIMLSNPRRLSGFFHESFRPVNESIYKQFTMSAINSKFVTKESVEGWKKMYGENSNTYRVEVLGEFPTREDDAIIAWDIVNEATERTVSPEGDMVWGMDVAAGGGDKSILVKRQGVHVFDDIKSWNEKDSMKLVGKLAKEYHEAPKEARPVKIFIDSVAIGKGAFDRCKEIKLPVYPAIAHEKASQQKFNINQKAEWWSNARDWFRDEEVQIPKDPELVEQLSTVRSKIHSSGRFQVEPKIEYKKRNPGIGSPDKADAFVMTFCQKRKAKPEIIFI
jgi:phage terminase large subunit